MSYKMKRCIALALGMVAIRVVTSIHNSSNMIIDPFNLLNQSYMYSAHTNYLHFGNLTSYEII